ncbi:hypothetical protein [Anaerobaca lacustris]|uniref:Uncharacterized protein n=1 Tax=Anaerobaca lacustris TaxID=3044600 RepID=A0AAW6U5K7_9BACT|nr:hypothetical protein [Sedimentisphaerales bacterium M17dextr]
MALAFVYLGAASLVYGGETPEPRQRNLSFELSDEILKNVKEFFKDPTLNRGIEQLKHWRDNCSKLDDMAEARKIAEASLSEKKVAEWREDFWKGYGRSSPVFSLCLENGNYEIDEDAHHELRYRLPKIAVIEWKYPISGANGDDYGRALGRRVEQALLRNLMKDKCPISERDWDLAEVVGRAASWLKERGCETNEALIVVSTIHGPASQLYREERFVPPWREDLQSRGFDGFYDAYPVVWVKSKDEDAEVSRPIDERVAAVDLRGWKGLRVRECVVSEGKFGELEIRSWTEKEIEKAMESGKLKREEVDRAKGNCPVKVDSYWKFSPDALPPTRVFQRCDGPNEEPESTSSKNESQ